jgi:hypothetical protein
VVVGLQSFFSSFVAYLLAAEYLRPQVATVSSSFIESSSGHDPHQVLVERVAESNGAAPALETV